MRKKYKVQFNYLKQYLKESDTTYLHKKVSTTLPIEYLNEIGINQNEPYIFIELDRESKQLMIKKV